jgi:hypothetical protein
MSIFAKRKVDLFVLPPTGQPGSGKFCWWTVRDRIGEIRRGYFMPNAVLAYYFAGMSDAQQLAEAQCERFKQGVDPIPDSPLSFGGPTAAPSA